jgi:hypothetical protein
MGVITNNGKAILTARLLGLHQEPLLLAWGTGSTAENPTQTALAIPSAEPEVTAVLSQVTTTVLGDTWAIGGTIVSQSLQSITEVGVFDSLTNVMFARAVFSARQMAPGASITFSIQIQFP